MTLRPIDRTAETTSPAYPARRAGTLHRAGRWALRAGAVALASASFWLAGCDLVGTRLGGDVAMPYYQHFTCAEEYATEQMAVPGTYEGEICEQGKYAWASFEVGEATTVEVALEGSGGTALDATAHVIDPTGLAVAEVPAGGGFVAVEAAPGSWRVAVIAGPSASAYQAFELTLQEPAGD